MGALPLLKPNDMTKLCSIINNNNNSHTTKMTTTTRKKILTSSTLSSLSMLLLLFMLVLIPTTVKCDDANLDDISQQQQHEAQKLLNIKPVKYSVWNDKTVYLSSTAYNARGMAPLYNITNTVINLFLDTKDPIPDGE